MQSGLELKNRKTFDISPLIHSKSAVFPGDQGFEREVLMDIRKGSHLELSSIRTTVHIGAHADAPIHYHPDGVGISDRSLEFYVGACQVIEVRATRNRRVSLSDLKGKKILAPRVLFKTGTFPNPDQWVGDFDALSVELIEWLALQGVRLVGVDTPSIDPSESKSLETHQAVFRYDMAILEGLVLHSVPEGIYQLIALPLRIQNADASPVRAILISAEGGSEV